MAGPSIYALCAFILCALVPAGLADVQSDLNAYVQSYRTGGSSTYAYLVPRNVTWSQGRRAVCVSGTVRAPVTANNTRLIIGTPPDQYAVSGIVQSAVSVGSTELQSSMAGPNIIQGTFGIAVNLCYPANFSSARSATIIQVLTHGSGLQKNYWDIAAPNNSYVDAAADRGYVTLAYDRLGVGGSDHPDGINTVQAEIQIEILEALIQGVRQGTIGLQKFSKVACVAHSFGSIIQTAHDAKYTSSCSSALVTGISDTPQYLIWDTFAINPTIANQNDQRFSALDNSYWVDPTPVSQQLPFYYYPYYSKTIFQSVFNTRETFTLGEIFTTTSYYFAATGYAGPVGVVDGQNDIPFCGGDCTGRPAAYKSLFYPSSQAAPTTTTIIPNTGHLINAHYNAPLAFKAMLDFLDLTKGS